jgi:hypothetical protein
MRGALTGRARAKRPAFVGATAFIHALLDMTVA